MVDAQRATLTNAATPALVLDRGRVERNAQRMVSHARRCGTRLRPHLKTLKSIDVAKMAIDPRHGGIAVATVNEARYFAAHGISDIQLAVCLAPTKIEQAAQLQGVASGFSFFLDSIEAARAAADLARTQGTMLRTWIEIDSGGHRTGVAPDAPELLAIAKALGGHVHLEGVATHAGQSYADLSPHEIATIAEAERQAVVESAERLRAAGFAVPGVSAGSTPTVVHAKSAEGLTEWRPGVYLAGDLYQAGIGSVGMDDLSLSVLATVISRNEGRRKVVVDAGGLALSKDRSTRSLAGRDVGYGLVTDLLGEPVFGDLYVAEVHQEHGEIHDVPTAAFDALKIGAKVRVFPNHACMTAAMYDEYLVVEQDTAIVARWPRTNGWS